MKTFEIATKKSKRRNLLKNVVFSTLGTITLLIGVYSLLNKMTSDNAWKIERYHSTIVDIAYPNIDLFSFEFLASSQFNGRYEATQKKDIAGIPVPFESYSKNYSANPRIASGSATSSFYPSWDGTAHYTYANNYKVPVFFNRVYDYSQHTKENQSKLTQDIELLPQMTGKAVEVAVTFDKSYTFEEIESMIPETLKINWYWIGTSSQYDTTYLGLESLIGFTPYLKQEMTFEESEEQIKQLHKEGSEEEREKRYQAYLKNSPLEQRFKNSYEHFKERVEQALHNKFLNYAVGNDSERLFTLQEDVEAYLKNNPDGKTAKFSGVILTGKAENFAQLEKAEWIFGSNIGQSIDIEPYHHLDTRHDPAIPQK
ncbi:anti sigma factor C-terminal domain-containing protein [Streptococcus pneumoniae]